MGAEFESGFGKRFDDDDEEEEDEKNEADLRS